MEWMYGSTEKATIQLPAKAARKLLEVGKIHTGWTVCRLREGISLCVSCRRARQISGHLHKHG